MQRRPLGDSGLAVSTIGLGTWAMGGDRHMWGQVDDRESIAAIHQALDRGINLIDTAPIYGRGHSEEIVGKAIQGRRDQVVLATKCGLLFPASPEAVPPRSLAPDSIRRECEHSLRRLRTEYIDLYQCHWPDPGTPIRETMPALASLKEQGKIRAIGVCNFSCEQLAAAREFAPVYALQAPFSMLTRRAADDLLPFCVEHGIGMLAYGPLAKGLLCGKFSASETFAGVRARDPEFIGQRYRRNLHVVERLRAIAERHGRTPAQLAINWVIHHEGVTSALGGAKRASQVQENRGAEGWSLSGEDHDRIQRILADGDDET